MNGLSLVYNIMELVAWILLGFDLRKGKYDGVSLQTLGALSVARTIEFSNKVYWTTVGCESCGSLEYNARFVVVSASMVAAWGCSWMLYRTSNVDDLGNDDIVEWGMPKWQRKCLPYVAAIVMSLSTMVMASGCSKFKEWFLGDPTWTTVTLDNMLQGVGFLPQLLLSQRRGQVTGVAMKFMLILSVKLISEFVLDCWMSWVDPDPEDASFLFGDLISSMVLLDFLYLYVKRETKAGRHLFGCSGMAIPL